jgi:hypothetical protein
MGTCSPEHRASCFHNKAVLLPEAKADYPRPLNAARLGRGGQWAAVLIAALGVVPLFGDVTLSHFGRAVLLLAIAAVVFSRASANRERAVRFSERFEGAGGRAGPDFRHCTGCGHVLKRLTRSDGAETFDEEPTPHARFRAWAEREGARFPQEPPEAPAGSPSP